MAKLALLISFQFIIIKDNNNKIKEIELKTIKTISNVLDWDELKQR